MSESISLKTRLASRSPSRVWLWFLVPLLLSVPASILLLFGRYWSKEMAVQTCIQSGTSLSCGAALYAWSNKLIIWACLSAILLIVILLRLRYRKPGVMVSTALFVAIGLILAWLFLGSSMPRPKTVADLLLALLPVAAVPLLIEVFLRLANPPEWRWSPFSIRESIAIVLFIGGCFMNLFGFMAFWPGAFSTALAIFFLAMSIMFARFLIDKFGTILIIAFCVSALVAILKPSFAANALLRSTLPLDILAIGWLVGLAVEGALAISSMKNVFYVFKAVRPGHINNAFVQASGNLSKAMVFSLVAPLFFLVLALDQPLASHSLGIIWAGITITFFGSVMSAFWCSDINRWGLVGLLRPTFRQIWWREFDKWVCSVAVDDIDGDGINEMIVGCADHQVYCLRNGELIWQTALGNPPAGSSAIEYIGAGDQKKYVTGCSDGKVYCISATGEILWEVQTPNWVWCCTAGDVDNDGECEVIAGGMDDQLHCYKDGGKEVWSAWFDSWVGCCAIGDADNDGLNEVVAGSNDETLRCFKNGPNEIWRAQFGEWVTCVAIGDVDGDGLNEVVAGSNDGTLRCFRNGSEIWRVSMPGGFNVVEIGDVDGDGLNEVVTCCGDNALRVYKKGKEVWAAGLEKYPDGLTIGDFNNDGQDEILMGDWYTWLRAFKSTRLIQQVAGSDAMARVQTAKQQEVASDGAPVPSLKQPEVAPAHIEVPKLQEAIPDNVHIPDPTQRQNSITTGACGISCNFCGLKVKEICIGCGPGTMFTVEAVADAPCPILKCAVAKGVAHCPRDCDDFPCTMMDGADYPYSAAYRGMFRQRMDAAEG